MGKWKKYPTDNEDRDFGAALEGRQASAEKNE